MDNNREKMNISNNQRIAKNTLMLYIRQIVILAVSLYTSRLVLNALGAEEYGIYQVVGGFVAMFNIVSGAFTVAVTRFMSHEYISENPDDIRKCYSTALIIQAATGTTVCLLIATVGVWYVKNIMVLPEGRIGAALIVLAFSAITFFISLLCIPFNSLIIANERMQAFAYIGLAEACIKLLIAFVILKASDARLILYSGLMMLSSLTVLLLQVIYCKRYFRSACRFTFSLDKGMIRSMLSFISWAFLGNGSVMIKTQGVNMVMNYFGGPIVNAARGIANSVSNAVTSFTNNYIQAIQPQITKLCSANQKKQMTELIFLSTRFSFFLMLIFILPIYKNLDYILRIWLGKNIPKYTMIFIVMALLETLIDSIGKPMLYGVLATGKIRNYEILLTVIYTSSLPLSFISLKNGMPMIAVYVIAIILTAMVVILLIWQSKMTYGLSIKQLFSTVILRIFLVTLILGSFTYILHVPISNLFFKLVVESLFIVIVTIGCILLIGFNRKERNKLFSFIKNKIKRIHN